MEAIMRIYNHRSPFVFSLPVFLLIVSVYCLCIEVEEVKRRQHCLMFSSAGSQAQTYFVNFDALADYQRWHRQASKVSQEKKACVLLCACRTQYVSPRWFDAASVCFLFVPLGSYLNPRLAVGTAVVFRLLSCSIRNRLSECVWFAPQKQPLSGVCHWLNRILLTTIHVVYPYFRGNFDWVFLTWTLLFPSLWVRGR